MLLLRNPFLVAGILIVAGAFQFVWFSDIVTSRYSTRRAAEADRLFDRGWLPEIIPLSSRKIVTINNLDSNTSKGEFSFDPHEAHAFLAHLRRLTATEVPEPEAASFFDRGYSPYAYRRAEYRWIFFVDPEEGHCEYQLAPSPTNGQSPQDSEPQARSSSL